VFGATPSRAWGAGGEEREAGAVSQLPCLGKLVEQGFTWGATYTIIRTRGKCPLCLWKSVTRRERRRGMSSSEVWADEGWSRRLLAFVALGPCARPREYQARWVAGRDCREEGNRNRPQGLQRSRSEYRTMVTAWWRGVTLRGCSRIDPDAKVCRSRLAVRRVVLHQPGACCLGLAARLHTSNVCNAGSKS
jgi:hypothetical protein